MANELPKIQVQAAADVGPRVALFDRNPAYDEPGEGEAAGQEGEIFIHGADRPERRKVHTVRETPAVLAALRDGRLVRVEGRAAAAPERQQQTQEEAAEAERQRLAEQQAGGEQPSRSTRR